MDSLSHAVLILQDSGLKLHQLSGAGNAGMRQRLMVALTGRSVSVPNSTLRELTRTFYANARISADTAEIMRMRFSQAIENME